MKIPHALFSAVLLIFTSSLAFAQNYEVINDKSGMPLCIIHPEKDEGFIRFIWNKDSFRRDIFVEYHKKKENKLCNGEKRKFLRERFPAVDLKAIIWEATKKRLIIPAGVSLVSVQKFKSESKLMFELPPEVMAKFEQVRLGSNVYISEDASPLKFLHDNEVEEYTVELNRELTKKYGAGFSAETYKAWLETKPQNLEFKNFISDGINNGSRNEFVGKNNGKYMAVFVKGFGHSLGGNDRYQPFIDDVRSLGLEMQVLYTEPYGRTPDNTYAIIMQLNELLSQGKNLIVVCGSNGCLQAIAAMAELQDKLERNSPEGYGKIGAMLSLSGVFYGAFAADWATKNPKWFFVRKGLHEGLKNEGIEIEKSKLDSFKDLRMDFVKEYLSSYVPQIPQETKYFHVIGVPLHDGLVKDPEIGSLQSSIIRPHIKGGFGANDGYIEFPGTTMDPTWAPHMYTAALDASHAVLDGNFEGIPVQDDTARKQLVSSLMNFILSKLN